MSLVPTGNSSNSLHNSPRRGFLYSRAPGSGTDRIIQNYSRKRELVQLDPCGRTYMHLKLVNMDKMQMKTK
jgi:hypothetical protein